MSAGWAAIARGVFEGQAVYWLGPIAGAVAAAFLYDLLFLPRGPEAEDSGALLPADEGTGRTRTASGIQLRNRLGCRTTTLRS